MTLLQDGVSGGQAHPKSLHGASYPWDASPPPQFLTAEYCGAEDLPRGRLGVFPPSFLAGPSLTSCFLLSCTPRPVLMF